MNKDYSRFGQLKPMAERLNLEWSDKISWRRVERWLRENRRDLQRLQALIDFKRLRLYWHEGKQKIFMDISGEYKEGIKSNTRKGENQ